MNIKNTLIIILLISTSPYTHAQEQEKVQTKEVIVEKEYEPVVREWERITILPEFQDTGKVELNFTYDIHSSALYGHFKPRTIQPAKLTGEPIRPIEHSYLLLGLGNYLSGIGQFRIGSLRKEEYQWFAGADFLGAFGKMNDHWNRDVDASYIDTEILAGGKKFFKRTAIEANTQFNSNQHKYYGQAIDPSTVTTPVKPQFDNQTVTRFKGQVSAYSFDSRKDKANFTSTIAFNHLQAQNKVVEDKFDLGVNIDKYYEKQFLGVETKLKYIRNENLSDTLNSIFVDFNPWLGLFGRTWRIQAGVNSTYNEKTARYYLYPNIKLHYNIAAYFLVPYIEVTGNYRLNDFERIVTENFFINPNQSVMPTNNKLLVKGGLRGMASSRFGFNISAIFQQTENQYFYIPDLTISGLSLFTVEYDNISAITVSGELSWKQSDKLNIILRGQYSTYTLDSLPAPWHIPQTIADLTMRYNLNNKVAISSDIFFRGERTVKNIDGQQKILAPLIDVNLMVEYQLNRILGFFIKGSNLLNRRQYVYDYYQMHRMFVMGGVKILF